MAISHIIWWSTTLLYLEEWSLNTENLGTTALDDIVDELMMFVASLDNKVDTTVCWFDGC